MARFFFNLHECGTILNDVEGMDCATTEAALSHALRSARDVMVGELRNGQLCLGCFISVADFSGKEVGRVQFRDAVTITGFQDRPTTH